MTRPSASLERMRSPSRSYCAETESRPLDPFFFSQEVALAFQNNLAYALGQARIWADTYYVGTFGEYDMSAVRGKQSL